MVNKVILLGNLGNDPELRYTSSGQPVCDLRVATKETWKGRDGEKNERTEWHRVVVWGKQGENASKYLSKGRQVFVEGRIQTRSWEDKEGNKRYTTEIVASNVLFLPGGAKRDYQEREASVSPVDDFDAPPPADNGADDDIPF